MTLPAYDDHLHVSPSGRNIEALKEYKAAGGTGMTLVTLPYPEVRITCGEDFRRSFAITSGYAEKAREMGLKVYTAVGPYPILLISLAEEYGLERAESIMMKGMDIAMEMVENGEADLIGEVGRPHFPTDQRYVDASNRILQHGFDLAARNGTAVMIHCETDEDTFRSLSDMASSAGLPPEKVVKHSSPPVVRSEATFGVTTSIPSSRKLIRQALAQGDGFMVETDFIDDPAKPGSIMSVNTVPKRIKGLYSSGELSEESVYRMCQDLPDSLYSR